MKTRATASESTEDLEVLDLTTVTVRQFTDRFPETMQIFGAYGIDLCCGGGRPVEEALAMHGADVDAVLMELSRIIAGDQRVR